MDTKEQRSVNAIIEKGSIGIAIISDDSLINYCFRNSVLSIYIIGTEQICRKLCHDHLSHTLW